MKEKINIAELLKDCPKGMELDCTMFDNVTFVQVLTEQLYPIHIKVNGYIEYHLSKEGCYHDPKEIPNAKCVIFPKGKTTWEGFQRPFKDGDVVVNASNKESNAFIYRGKDDYNYKMYVGLLTGCVPILEIHRSDAWVSIKNRLRFATEEEKEKLFKAIKDNGYKWNAETKTLEKLIVPKFKVGDWIKSKDICTKYLYDNHIFTITEISRGKYWSNRLAIAYIEEQDDWELVPNKFDITTLKPFDEVLIRDTNEQKWTVDMFSFYDKTYIYPFVCIGHYTNQCIPYKGNEHLLGTTNDCDEYFKTWK